MKPKAEIQGQREEIIDPTHTSYHDLPEFLFFEGVLNKVG